MNGEPELDGQADPKPLGGQSDPNDLLRLADLENTESYTNGISFLDSLQLRSRNSEELGTEKLNNSILADLAELEDPKSPKSTYEPELLRDNVSKDFVGDKIPDLLANNTDSKAAKHSEILLQNNESCNKDTERLYDNSTDSQETTNDNDESLDAGATNESDENVVKETETIHGLESDHNSEDDSCQYVDDAEDPISSDPKEDEQEILNKLISKESEKGTFKIVTINKYNTDEENSSDSSGSDEEPKAEAVSFTSDGDNSRDDKLKCSDVFMLDDKTDNLNGTKSLEVHEIVSDNSENDDCIVTAVDKVTKSITKRKNTKSPPGELRRSSRAVKRKKYDDEIEELDDDDASDLEEVQTQDPLQNKHIAISNPKSIVGIASKIKRKIGQKMLDTIVIVDSPEKNRATKPNILSQNLYQKIAARGTSVTPISTKLTETKSIATQADSEPILPTLTDDMFVVEAPSFIVPYVYEKPAPMPFKEFVDKWGKEIEEEKLKEAEELKEKKKLEKAKREKERQEKRERGEEVQESEEEETEEINRKKAERAEKKERRRRKKLKEDDDVSWDGSSSEESDDESISDDESQTKEALIGDIKDVAPPPPKTDSYFDLSLGKFFMDIGSNLVQQYVQADLLHQQNKKLRREKKSGQSTKSRQVSIALLSNNLELSKKTNAPFTFEQKICKLCSFQTESALALEYHLETPHMKNNIYVCSYCSLELHGPHNILFHLDKTHAIKGRLERPPALHQCVNCPFEDHVKGKLARHLVACAKKFKPETNLAPPVEWEHPAKIKISKLTRPRAPVPFQAAQFARHPTDGGVVSGIRIPIGTDLSHQPRMQMTPVRPTGVLIRQASPHQPTIIANAKKQPNNAILISPAPRQATPIQPLNATNAKGVVMCEICDGYIKDLEQLRNHMQWIHKVKIHPKMIYNRPPLNCQKCQFRFFTDQGLERHLLGSHGLVTSAIQEAANKGKDAGRCPVCGRAYQRKLLAHVSRDHNLVLKPAHLSYKCTVCTATFGMYRQFESHVYSTHSVVAKKAMDKKPPAPVKGNPNDDAAKQLKNNENITIIPQPVKIGAAKRK